MADAVHSIEKPAFLKSVFREHPRLRKFSLWAASLLLFMTVILIALPFAVARFAESWLRDNGAVNARIENVDINPFTGVVLISGLEASGDANERLVVGTAELNLRWWPLFSKRIYIEGLQLADIQIDIAAEDTGSWRIGGVMLTPAEADPTEVTEETAETVTWGLGSEAIYLGNVQVTYQDAVFDTRIDINEIRLGSQFSWEAARTTEFVLDLAVNDAPLVVRSDVAPWAEQRRFSGALNLQDFDLTDYRQVLQSLAGVNNAAGTLNLELVVEASFSTDGDLQVGISGPVSLENADFAIDALSITNQSLLWSGDVAILLPATVDAPLLRVDGNLQLNGSHLAQDTTVLDNQLFSWQGQVEMYTGQADGNRLLIDGNTSLTGTEVSLTNAALTNQSLTWQGQVEMLSSTTEGVRLQVGGNLDTIDTSVTQDAISLTNQSLTWQGQVEMLSSTTEGVQLQVGGNLDTADTNVTQDAISLANQTLNWQGDINLELPLEPQPTQLHVDGGLQLASVSVNLATLELEGGLGAMDWSGVIDFATAVNTEPSAIAMQADFTSQELSLAHDRLPFNLLSLDAFDIPGISVSSVDQATVAGLNLQGLQLLGAQMDSAGSENSVLALEQLTIAEIIFDSQAGLTIDSLQLVEPRITLVRNASGEINRIGQTIALFSESAEPVPDIGEPVETQPDNAFPITLAGLNVNATNLLSFQDLSVTPPASFRLTDTDIGVDNIDTSGDQAMTLRLATGNGTMTLAVEGDINAFAENLSADLAVKLASLDLPPLSPYVPGYNIDRGRLSVDSSVAVNGDALDVRNAVAIDRLTLSGRAAEGNDILSQGMAMPLDVALDLLRDGDDRIALNIPVTGSLSDPQFGTRDIVRVAMQRALQNAAMSYVTNALQPLGTILFVADLASQASRPRFEPIAMLPGESELSTTAREYLLKISELLTERPSLQLTMCGVATAADREALVNVAIAAQQAALATNPTSVVGSTPPTPGVPAASGQAATLTELLTSTPQADVDAIQQPRPEISDQALLELAALRTSAATGFLANDGGIVRERLFNCRETIEASTEDGPRVEIGL